MLTKTLTSPSENRVLPPEAGFESKKGVGSGRERQSCAARVSLVIGPQQCCWGECSRDKELSSLLRDCGSPARLAKQYDPMKNAWIVYGQSEKLMFASELPEWEVEELGFYWLTNSNNPMRY